LEGTTQSTKGMKLEPVGSPSVHFRQLGGNPPPQQITIRNTGTLPVRIAPDGLPPLSTALRIDNVDGDEADSAIFEVFDEEPPPPTSGSNRPDVPDSEFSLILGSSASSGSSHARAGLAASGGTQYLSDGWIRNLGSDVA